MAFEIFLIVIIILLAFPAGLWIAWLARDELEAGRKWYALAGVLAFLLALIALLFREISAFTALLFFSILAGVAWWKSYDKKWVVAWGRLD